MIICADLDKEDYALNEKLENFCLKEGYHLVYMNKDIENVFLGRSVKQTSKVNAAHNFLIEKEELLQKNTNLKIADPKTIEKSSNLLLVIEELLGAPTNSLHS